MSTRLRRTSIGLLVLSLLGVGCGAPVPDKAPETSGALSWQTCGMLECGWLSVPADYDHPDDAQYQLRVVRRRAGDPAQRVGVLLVNPGGPGYGGAALVEHAERLYSPALLAHFDLVGWDPRGTGGSRPAVACGADYDALVGIDITPDTPAEHDAVVRAAERFVAACQTQNGALLAHVSTNDSARDIDTLRRALGEPTVSYFGFSYGSELGATWMQLFPDTVRAAVLDGAVDPGADALTRNLAQAGGLEAALTAFFAWCDTLGCAYAPHQPAAAAFDALMARIETNPIPTVSTRPELTHGIAFLAVIHALYSANMWPALDAALAQLTRNRATHLLDLYDQYLQRRDDASYGHELEALLAITCLDDPGPVGVAGVDAVAERYARVAPRLGRAVGSGYVCALWPEAPQPRVTIRDAGRVPVVVIATTEDPVTPVVGAEAMAGALHDGRVVIATARQHTGYRTSACVDTLVDRYLVELVVPDRRTQC